MQRVANVFMPKGLSAAQDVLLSPWSDGSHLETVTFESMYGIGVQGAVGRSAAISVATVAGGRDVLTGRIARCPLLEFGNDGQLTPQQPTLLSQLERGRTRSQTVTWAIDAMFFHGRTFFHVVERGADGFPLWLQLVPEKDAELNDEGQMIRAFGELIQPRNSIRVDGPHEGLLNRGADTIRRALRLNRAAAKAENNPVPSIDLHNEGEDLNADERKQLLASWERARTTSGVGYSSKSLKVNVLGQPAEQLLIDGRKAITLELLRHMGAGSNPEIVASAVEGTGLTYTNKASREAALIDNFLAPYMTAFEDRFSMNDMRPRGRTVRFDTSVLTREDTATRYANYKTAKELELLSTEDIKKVEGVK
jgi:hypothetical protein